MDNNELIQQARELDEHASPTEFLLGVRPMLRNLCDALEAAEKEIEHLQGKLQDQEYQIALDAMEQGRDEAIARAEKAEAENRWIPVSEKLPEEETPVLIICKNDAVFVAEYKGTDYELRKIWSVKGPLGTGRRVASSRVTHWLALPKPPKGDRE